MEKTFITWNVPNHITIALMALISFMVLILAMQLIKRARSGAASEDSE